MFANRFTAVVDACVLASALKRNLVLSLAEAEFFRLRWSEAILDETERAIGRILSARWPDAASRATRARSAMQRAFQDAAVVGGDVLMPALMDVPDPGDRHVVATAVRTRASVIVTDNLRHFPAAALASLDLEAKSADSFIADTIDLDVGRAVAALRQMRGRFRRPTLDPAALLLAMDAAGLPQTVDTLRDHVLSL